MYSDIGLGLYVMVNDLAVQEQRAPDGETYIFGREWSEYSLLVTNSTDVTFVVTGTIDGRSITTGSPLTGLGLGYILPPRTKYVIPGWRDKADSQDYAARFVFAHSPGLPQNPHGYKIGAIRINFSRYLDLAPCYSRWIQAYEPVKGIWKDYYPKRYGSIPPAERASSIGTGRGRQVYHPVRQISVDHAEDPTETLAIHYNDRRSLQTLGVEPVRHHLSTRGHPDPLIRTDIQAPAFSHRILI